MDHLEVAIILLAVTFGFLVVIYGGLCWKRNSEALNKL